MSSAPLESVQRWLMDALMDPARASELTTGGHLLPSTRLPAAARLAIYQRSYILRLQKCMAEQFPALGHALGDGVFSRFAREYLQACPSRNYTLHDLGRRFPAYLEATRPDRDRPEAEREDWIDFMVDLAGFEQQLFCMFDAPGHEGQPFATPATPDDRLSLQPCFALGQFRYPVAWYYFQVRQALDPDFPARQRCYVAMSRRDYVTRTYPLTPVHHRFLQVLAQGEGVAAALRRVAADCGLPLATVAQAWSLPAGTRTDWIAAGFFTDREAATASGS